MTHNLNYGDRVTQILLKHPVWAEFKDQRHDLFIADTTIRGYLTGKLRIPLVLWYIIKFSLLKVSIPRQCIGNFDMIFGFLASNIFSDVRILFGFS